MKALTISQPFASLIARGEKWVENRCWPTNYRGPIGIHAGKGTQYLTKGQLAHMPSGCVIAIANLVACVDIQTIRDNGGKSERCKRLIPGTNRNWSEVSRHNHTEGLWCWLLEDVQSIEAVPVRGAQGLWEWDAPIVAST